jgi:polyisoprenoid-binding protein YceI
LGCLIAGGLSVERALSQNEAVVAPSGKYTTDPGHRYITFSYLHGGLSHPQIRWNNWEATLDWDSENPESSSVSVVIDATSIDTGVANFDGHMKGARFFDVANHPQITFVSTGAQRAGEDKGEITGDLAIKGVTKPVTLDVTYNSAALDQRSGRYKIGFSAVVTVKRSEFGMDFGTPYVGDDVVVTISAEFEQAAE